jgi:hypothetical protein
MLCVAFSLHPFLENKKYSGHSIALNIQDSNQVPECLLLGMRCRLPLNIGRFATVNPMSRCSESTRHLPTSQPLQGQVWHLWEERQLQERQEGQEAAHPGQGVGVRGPPQAGIHKAAQVLHLGAGEEAHRAQLPHLRPLRRARAREIPPFYNFVVCVAR